MILKKFSLGKQPYNTAPVIEGKKALYASLYFMACSMNEYERVRFLARLLVDFPYGSVFSVHIMS
jgi:hypothetical protein